MKSFASLLATSTALALAAQGVAYAEEVALSFDLDPPPSKPESTSADAIASPQIAVAAETQPLPIPAHGANPPVATDSGNTIAASRYGGSEAIALAQSSAAAAAKMLPPPPSDWNPVQVAANPIAPAKKAEPTEVAQETPEPEAVALSFAVKPAVPPTSIAATPPVPSPEKSTSSQTSLPINPFNGGTNSLAARIVGSAEGTRTPDGQRTAAYFGHQDPGNGVWNMGTFSYQHGAQTPEEADQKQLQRLQNQTQVLLKKASEKGIELTLEEKLNGIDLANQSPLAAIGRVGYIDRLAEARQMNLTGEEAIIWARTRSYINPDTNRWNAPGLGNTAEGVRRDQTRRMNAIKSAFQSYQQQHPEHFQTVEAPQSSDQASLPANHSAAEPIEDDVPFRLWQEDESANQPLPAQPDTGESHDETMAEATGLEPGAIPTTRVYSPAKSTQPAMAETASSPTLITEDLDLEKTGLFQAVDADIVGEHEVLTIPQGADTVDSALAVDLPSENRP